VGAASERRVPEHFPGREIQAVYAATNAVIAPSLGRKPRGLVDLQTWALVDPGTMFGDRINQVDLRFLEERHHRPRQRSCG